MTLKQDLLELAERLSRVIPAGQLPAWREEVMMIAAELRGIAKGMSEESVARQVKLELPDHLQEELTMKARLSALDAGQRSRREESNAIRMVEVIGGPAGDSSAPIPGNVPEGAFTSLAGACYQYRDGKLHHFVPAKG